jgi:hypothetical protein
MDAFCFLSEEGYQGRSPWLVSAKACELSRCQLPWRRRVSVEPREVDL